jgi:hypothetical protein
MTAIITFKPGSFHSLGEIIIGDYAEGGQRGGMSVAAHGYTGRKKDKFDLSVGDYFTTFKWEGFNFTVRDPEELKAINTVIKQEAAAKADSCSVRETNGALSVLAKKALEKLDASTWRKIVIEQVDKAYRQGWEAKTNQVNNLESVRADKAIPKKYQLKR